ncbi:phosphopantetheine-binding protein [Micromonospora sp. NBC_01638]|uniref:phosphopantetheine-binding protein n=1 Tax=Micromonospora sp. NBC_01638 TaxID=2975982 RepID=UPI00386EE53D|nr:phosphopantetheine-binding protein [Micromonospora sp. NBC_01638]
MSANPRLLVLDYPGRRPEAHISEMHLDRSGFDCQDLLTSPMPTALTTPAYASELFARQRPDRPVALVAYCAAAPLAVAMAALLVGPAGPVPIVLLDPQQTPPSEILHEYHEVVRQVEGRAPNVERPPLLDIEGLLATPETLVKRIGEDLRLRARLALAAFGFGDADVSGPVEGVVGVYVEWLTFLVAAHHDEQPAPRGPILQVISQGHPADAGWLGATDLQTVRVSCDRPELAADAEARAAVLDFLHGITSGASTETKGEEQNVQADLVTETELALARMWADVLGVDVVGRGDNFFDLGGDSMLATRLVLSARRTWNVDFSVRVLVDSPVLKDLADRIDVLVGAATTGSRR